MVIVQQRWAHQSVSNPILAGFFSIIEAVNHWSCGFNDSVTGYGSKTIIEKGFNGMERVI